MSHRGALWRRWDLHIHTPVSFQWRGERLKRGNTEQEARLYKATVEAINACKADAVGIMDYWTFDGYVGLRKFLRDNPGVTLDKAMFPGMELRVEAPVSFRMNIHVLLSDELTDQELDDFKSKLTLVLLDRPLSDEGIRLTADKMSPDKIRHVLPEYDDRGDTENRRTALGNETALIIPFIVDQPEGNLDNHTVYKLLGECIREAKERRQIIMVTHNPNLAVACDAEQIVCASIEPKNGHRVKYVAGSIENPEINRTVLNVLEGTRPAFDNREAKYFADEIGY